MRGEKFVNEPDGSLDLAFSDIESSQLIRLLLREEASKIVHFCQHLVSYVVFMWLWKLNSGMKENCKG